MLEPQCLEIRRSLDLAQYTGFPVYFFDFGSLIANVPAIQGWDHEKIGAVIGARADNVLSRADVRIPVPQGFYVVFCSHELGIAKERANAICTDILKHFFGMESLIPEGAHTTFCRVSDLRAMAAELGVAPPDEAIMGTAADSRLPVKDSISDLDSAPSLIGEMNELFRRFFGEDKADPRKFIFAPIWDSVHERIASFSCQPVQPPLGRWGLRTDSAIAAERCATDIAALAFALKGVWQIVSRGEIALVTVPVHIETLSWSKFRGAYLNELAHIEPRLLNLLAFRIHGLDMGLSLAQLNQGVSVLRRHARRVFAHLPSVGLDFAHAGIMGLTGLGVSAPAQFARRDEGSLDSLAAAATRLKRICASQNAIPYMDNVHSGLAVSLLKSQGVRLIAGPAFGPPSEEPQTVRNLCLSEIAGNGLAAI